MSDTLAISLPDGSVRSLDAGATGADLAGSIGRGLAKAAVAAIVNGEEWDLGRELPADASVSIVTADRAWGTRDGVRQIR